MFFFNYRIIENVYIISFKQISLVGLTRSMFGFSTLLKNKEKMLVKHKASFDFIFSFTYNFQELADINNDGIPEYLVLC